MTDTVQYVGWRIQNTYDAIVLRCRNLIPPIDLEKHIKNGTLRVANNKLDGISFEPVDADDLIAELGGRMKIPGAEKKPPPPGPFAVDTTRYPRPENASMISMREEPDNWALKCSLGATKGEGFRERWLPPPISREQLLPYTTPGGSDRISLGMGETGKYLKFTSLHAAVEPKNCNMHIDERGFVLSVPEGAVVTPTFYGHLVNELLLKSEFRDWLKGKLPDSALGHFVIEVVNRVSARFPDAENRFAGLSNRVNNISGIKDLGGIGKAFLPIGVSVDLVKLRNSTVQANYYNYDGQQTITVSWGGTFEAFGSK